jgi:hypothetical protein
MDKIKKEIKGYSALEDNYDGYDGVAPKRTIVNAALKLINILEEIKPKILIPKAMLSPSGNIGLYWNIKGEGQYIEIEIDSKHYYNYILKDKDLLNGDDDCNIDNIEDSLLFALKRIS